MLAAAPAGFDLERDHGYRAVHPGNWGLEVGGPDNVNAATADGVLGADDEPTSFTGSDKASCQLTIDRGGLQRFVRHASRTTGAASPTLRRRLESPLSRLERAVGCFPAGGSEALAFGLSVGVEVLVEHGR